MDIKYEKADWSLNARAKKNHGLGKSGYEKADWSLNAGAKKVSKLKENNLAKNSMSNSSPNIETFSEELLCGNERKEIQKKTPIMKGGDEKICSNGYNVDENKSSKKMASYEEVNRGFVAKLQDKQERNSDSKNKILKLDEMERIILSKIKIIRHDGGLYFFNGRSYEVISDDDRLLELIRLRVSEDAFASSGLKRFGDLVRYMRAAPSLIPPDYEEKLKRSRYLVALKNGVYDLKKSKLLEHSSEYMVFNELDASYTTDQNAPTFWSFLESVSNGNKMVMIRILQSMGYIFSGLNEGKCFFVMGTASDSGKSTLGELVSKILGEKLVCHISPQQLSTQFGLGNIEGKILNLSMDLPKGKFSRNTVSLLKQITGGDGIVIEQKYQKSREIHSKMRFLFSTNYSVTISSEDDDDAFWKRMIVIPFMYSVDSSQKDLDLIDRLYKERDVIVSCSLGWCRDLINNKYIFKECRPADLMKEEWRNVEMEAIYSVEDFMAEKVIITGSKEDIELTSTLYEEYEKYCIERQYKPVFFNLFRKYIDSFYKECEHIRTRKGNKNPRSSYTGLKLKTQKKDFE